MKKNLITLLILLLLPLTISAQAVGGEITRKKPNTTTTATTKKKTPGVRKRVDQQRRASKNQPEQEDERKSSSLSLGYAIWSGPIKNGKPDGKGTMRFSSNHRIEINDPDGHIANSGDRIDGVYHNGHLEYGIWIKSDGSRESLYIGQ